MRGVVQRRHGPAALCGWPLSCRLCVVLAGTVACAHLSGGRRRSRARQLRAAVSTARVNDEPVQIPDETQGSWWSRALALAALVFCGIGFFVFVEAVGP